MASDPFARPLPMQSLATEQEGQWKWNKPPQYADFRDFVEAFEKKVEDSKILQEDFLDMFLIGATIEDVVNTISLTAFTEGKVTPDAAELSKAAIAVFLIDLAMKNKVPVTIFSETPAQNNLKKTSDKIKLMKSTNPEGFAAGMEDFNREQMQSQSSEAVGTNSFMDMET